MYSCQLYPTPSRGGAKEEIRCQDGIFTKLVRIAMQTKGFRPTTRLNDNDGFKSLVTAMIIQMTMYYTSNSSLEIWEARAIDARRGGRGERSNVDFHLDDGGEIQPLHMGIRTLSIVLSSCRGIRRRLGGSTSSCFFTCLVHNNNSATDTLFVSTSDVPSA